MYEEVVEQSVGLTDGELDERVCELELQLRALQAEQAVVAAVIQARGSYRTDGHRSINAYLRATLNYSDGRALELRRLATVCDQLPELGEALWSGRIGLGQVLEIARIHRNPRTRSVFSVVAPIYLARAEHCSHRELHHDVTSFLNLADQDGAFAEMADDVEGRTARMNVVDGALDVSARGGDPLVASEVVATFTWFCQHELQRDVDERRARHGDRADDHPLPRTDQQRRFDALVTMARAARAHGDGSTPAKVVINVVADPATLNESFAESGLVAASTHEDGEEDIETVEVAEHHVDPIIRAAVADPEQWVRRRCHTSTGTPIHPTLLAKAAISAHVRRVVVDADNVIIDAGRSQRLFTGAARELAKLLTSHCTHPGCIVGCTYADVDHMTEWHDAGRTDQSNADVGCGSHNRFKSRQRWRTRRDDTGRPFRIRPDGTVVLPVGARQPHFTVRDECERAKQRLQQLTAEHDNDPP